MMFASFLELNTVTLRATKVLEKEKTVKVEEKTSSNKKRKTVSSVSNKKANVVKTTKVKREKIKFCYFAIFLLNFYSAFYCFIFCMRNTFRLI